jgi:hypothetical protein
MSWQVLCNCYWRFTILTDWAAESSPGFHPGNSQSSLSGRVRWRLKTAQDRFLGSLSTTAQSALDLLLLFPYISSHARSAFPQVLRGLLQEMRPRRVNRNGRLPCQLHIRGVLAVWRKAEVSTLRSDPRPAPFRGPEKWETWSGRCLSRPAPQGAPRGRQRPLIISVKAPA